MRIRTHRFRPATRRRRSEQSLDRAKAVEPPTRPVPPRTRTFELLVKGMDGRRSNGASLTPAAEQAETTAKLKRAAKCAAIFAATSTTGFVPAIPFSLLTLEWRVHIFCQPTRTDRVGNRWTALIGHSDLGPGALDLVPNVAWALKNKRQRLRPPARW